MGVASIFLRTDRFLIDVKDKFLKKVEYENLIFFLSDEILQKRL